MTDAIQKILVATDGSETSLSAAGYASGIAKCTGAEVVILFALQVSGVTQFVTYSVNPQEEIVRDVRETGEEIVERTKKPFLQADVPVHTRIVEGFAAEVILKEARDGGYDLIVMGSRGAGTGIIKRLMLGVGSVAERVLGNSPCPVLIYRT